MQEGSRTFTNTLKISNLRSILEILFIKKSRTQNVIVGGLCFSVIRLLCSIISYCQIGVIVRYLLPRDFGLWATVSSFNMIFSITFNFGIGNALQNKVSKLYAQRNDEESQIYFFSVYYSLCLVSLITIISIFLVNAFIPWDVLFKTDDYTTIKTGSFLFLLFSSITMISLPSALSDKMFYSYQESWWSAFFILLSALLQLLSSVILVYLHSSFVVIVSSLSLMSLINSISSFVVMLIKRGWNIIPIKLKIIKAKVKELLPESLQFFCIQVPSIFLLFLDTLIVSKTTGLEIAGDYFLVKKLSLFFATIYMSLFAPIWACYTEATERRDIRWVKKVLFFTGVLTIAVYLVFVPLFFLFGDDVVHLWTGRYIKLPVLYLLLGLWSFLHSWGSCFSVYLNATGKLKLQAFLLTIGTVALFPLSIYLGDRYGVVGICLAWIIVSLPLAISNPIQSFVLIRRQSSTQVI
jgi:O-antigen/teichoic acid export membrane protein